MPSSFHECIGVASFLLHVYTLDTVDTVDLVSFRVSRRAMISGGGMGLTL